MREHRTLFVTQFSLICIHNLSPTPTTVVGLMLASKASPFSFFHFLFFLPLMAPYAHMGGHHPVCVDHKEPISHFSRRFSHSNGAFFSDIGTITTQLFTTLSRLKAVVVVHIRFPTCPSDTIQFKSSIYGSSPFTLQATCTILENSMQTQIAVYILMKTLIYYSSMATLISLRD